MKAPIRYPVFADSARQTWVLSSHNQRKAGCVGLRIPYGRGLTDNNTLNFHAIWQRERNEDQPIEDNQGCENELYYRKCTAILIARM